MNRRFIIIGGGIIGLATAYQLLKARPGLSLTLLEKEAGPGRHQTGNNSGVLHAGLYYKPGSLKARMAVEGIRQMTAFCREHDIPHEICGKLVVATNPAEEERLRHLEQRGHANGLSGLRLLNGQEIRTMEPHAAGSLALHVPEEGIVDYDQVCARLVQLIEGLGGKLHFNAKVRSIEQRGEAWVITAGKAEHEADFIINCAGLHSDRIAAKAGENSPIKIIPFRGEYYKLRPHRQDLVRNLIYPVPDPTFPFLGVHFTRLIHGGIEAGPNAVLACAREGYRKSDINVFDLGEALTFPGFWRFLSLHRRMCWKELRQSWSKELFAAELQKLVPEIRAEDLAPGGAGVRAQAMSPAGELVQDFSLVRRPHALHVINAPSPGATASLAIGGELAHQLADVL